MSAKTLYKLSGALILFNGSKLQWTQVFDAITTEGVKAEEGDCCVTEIAVRNETSLLVQTRCFAVRQTSGINCVTGTLLHVLGVQAMDWHVPQTLGLVKFFPAVSKYVLETW